MNVAGSCGEGARGAKKEENYYDTFFMVFNLNNKNDTFSMSREKNVKSAKWKRKVEKHKGNLFVEMLMQ